MAVSEAAPPSRIQTTPEIHRKDGGDTRTWAVVAVALTVLLGLMLIPAVTALQRSEAIYRDIQDSQQQFQVVQRVFESVSQSVFTISITIREFLLDSSPDAGRIYRGRLQAAREQLQENVTRLKNSLQNDGAPVLEQLQREVDAYLALVLSVFDWTPQQRAERGAYFLREEQRPRRESVLAVADRLADVNASIYAAQQRRTADSEDRFRRDLTRSVVVALLIGVVVSVAGMLRMRVLERRAHEQHQRAEQNGEELRSLSVQLRHAQEEERRTISRELHDEVGQKLTAMRMELGALERLRTVSDREFIEVLDGVKDLAEQSLRLVRDIAAALRPSVLDDLGLDAALHKHAREFSRRTGTPIAIDVRSNGAVLNDRQRTYIYRITQEALTNCAKHAHARKIAISLIDSPTAIALTIADDGVGFEPASGAHAGLGLVGIEERVRELGGSLAVRSAPGRGTTLQVTIPRTVTT